MTPDAFILHALRMSARALSVPELADAAGLPAEALGVRIAGLRAAGYEIELAPHLGYRLAGTPDRLIADDLQARLCGVSGKALRIARKILVFEETGSTNDVVARLARAGEAEGTVVFAERQTAGRGRLGRRWESAARKGLWFSLLLRPGPGLGMADWARLTTWAAVGAARGIEEAVPGCRAGIKWPNDIYLSGRKAVGILIESGTDPGGGAASGFAVVGIGVNVNQGEADFPADLAEKATSLRAAAGGGVDAPLLDRQAVAAALLRQLDALYAQLGSDFPAIVAEAQERSVLVGRWVEIRTPSGILQGLAEGLEPDGSLRVRGEDGRAITVSGGEVTIARW